MIKVHLKRFLFNHLRPLVRENGERSAGCSMAMRLRASRCGTEQPQFTADSLRHDNGDTQYRHETGSSAGLLFFGHMPISGRCIL